MKYLLVEFRRTFFSYKFLIGITGVAFSHFFSIYKIVGIDTSVYATYVRAVYFIPFTICLIFCAVPHAQSFCEDIEYGYIRQIALRTSLKYYTASRVALIYLSSIITMILGTLVFVVIVHMKVPWLSKDDYINHDILAEFFLNTNHYILYFKSFFWGLLSALLSILAAYVSLFWINRLLVLSLPFIIYCALIYYMRTLFKNIPQMDIALIFNPSYNVWNNKIISLIWPIWLTATVMIILIICMYQKLRRGII